jgi:hypothetical protein
MEFNFNPNARAKDARPELEINLERMAVLPVIGRKPIFKLAHPKHETIYVALPTKKVRHLPDHRAWHPPFRQQRDFAPNRS